MTDKPRSSAKASDDEAYRLAVGKIEQYNLLERLYEKLYKEKRDLEKKLSQMQQSNKDSTGAPSSRTETSMKKSFSVTREILDAATAQQLEHPVELYQVMEKEKNQEIEILRKKSEDAQRDLKRVQRERDELNGQIHQLMTAMSEKDECMKTLEQSFEETLTDDERRNPLERKQILRELDQKGAGSSWVVVKNQDDTTTLGTIELRRKIDELQRRITELLNHNEKWNALCQGLQAELDRVKGQLMQYQNAEGSIKHSLNEDLKAETKRRQDAEEMSQKAKEQVEELEVKIFQLERQLEDKEKQERELSMKAKELQVETLLYKEQAEVYKEDYENEQRNHNITRGQLDSLKNQWITIYKELQAKTPQLTAMKQRLEMLESNNNELQKQLVQARRDAQLIRDHQQRQQQHTRTPSTENVSWECRRCTYRNREAACVCEMCATSRSYSPPNEPFASGGHSSPVLDLRETRPFGPAPGLGQLEEDGIACY